ncbi:3-hydroxyacyl-CoA dehydrogenase family protein [Microbacterium kunmingense]|uniref:3-hydroxyacyl-CoA dehydrogenase family protein n=1 Tax=Microbacterium kunmingense TaxID=2915939 RepID=UPI00249DBC98|nr:3-hydroxyacyl-CoA dehydrogenase family protein [Microbacterium kunmingense]
MTDAADAAPRDGSPPGPGPVAPPSRVGVLGGGRMGAGIAHAFLVAGSEVTVVERDAEAAESARGRILASVADSIRRGATDRSQAALAASVHLSTDVSDFAGAGLVVEAVPEDRDLKRDALARIEAVVAGDTVLATNTSSIGLAALADALRDPARFLGLHFFNPVPASRLVEIVVGDASAAGVVERARGWVETLGKTPIVVADAPGFASSRLGLALALEAIRMVEAGVASPANIDAAMELGYRHPAGPLRTTDIVGLDVRLAIAEELHATLGDRFAPPDLLRRMVADGHLGRKTGRGFYEWSSP